MPLLCNGLFTGGTPCWEVLRQHHVDAAFIVAVPGHTESKKLLFSTQGEHFYALVVLLITLNTSCPPSEAGIDDPTWMHYHVPLLLMCDSRDQVMGEWLPLPFVVHCESKLIIKL